MEKWMIWLLIMLVSFVGSCGNMLWKIASNNIGQVSWKELLNVQWNLKTLDDFVVTMDSDNTHDPKYVLDMLTAAEHADVVVGSRYVDGGAQLNVPLHRVILSRTVNLLIEKLFGLRLKDATSGFRCFRASFLKRLRNVFRDAIIESSGFTASLELLLKAVASGGVVDEVPIFLDYGKKGGVSKMRLFSTVVGYLSLVFRYRVLNGLKRYG